MKADPIEVRLATPADAEEIHRVHLASVRTLCARDYTPEQIQAWAGFRHPDNYRRWLAAMIAQTREGEVW